MAYTNWKIKYSEGGVCDFKENYDFFFKWLLNKVASCFYLKNLPETVDEWYTKTNLILDGFICVTDFDEKLYSCIGAPGGMPDEYYVPTIFTIANPILGSKQVTIGKDGVVIYNTSTDKFYSNTFCSGLYTLIKQTATLLADNIISINANQINSRVVAFFTADSPAQAAEAEIILKEIYAGKPYKILRSDIVERLQCNPISSTNTSSNITELVQLHNYIIGNFFQSIGIKSNNVRKNAHVLQEEIDSQDNFLQISLFEILTSWQKGWDEVNELYGTNVKVELNPALIEEIISLSDSQSVSGFTIDPEDGVESGVTDTETLTEGNTSDDSAAPDNNTSVEETDNNSSSYDLGMENDDDNGEVSEANPVEEKEESVVEAVEKASEEIEDLVDLINDSAKQEEGGEEQYDVSEQSE